MLELDEVGLGQSLSDEELEEGLEMELEVEDELGRERKYVLSCVMTILPFM